ncbi:MAG: hypothetical protein R3348_01035 [Xanthomonadales bacterium]|nr:hypothetical protein [Xanthomonadales bacterium]
MKSVVLLAIALFLISAPAPDARDIAEMTSNFIVPENAPGLRASDAESASPEQVATATDAKPGANEDSLEATGDPSQESAPAALPSEPQAPNTEPDAT